ncbi:MAG: response regulator transcription factor [Verrucomicrobiaceae bacterium]|nr:MAG: response regulator transcription factor [Verrucomicrobiaceae bacterium]
MRVFIVDDENPARREMKRLLAAHSDVETAGEYASAVQALKEVAERRPDLIFLDIQMPDRSGLDAAAQLAGCGAAIVFVTAYDEHALQAFDLAALDYLLKPVEPERLARTLDRVRHGQPPQGESGGGVSPAAPAPAAESMLRPGDRIFLRGQDRHWFTPLSAIRLLQSEGNHTRVFFDSEKPLVSRSLNALEQRLPPQLFFRANRSQIVNLKWIVSTEEWFSGSLKVRLEDGTEIEFSRRQSRLFREGFSL